MRIDYEKIQTAANQVGVVIIAGGLVQAFFGHVGAIHIGSLIGIGVLLIFTSSIQRGDKK